MERAIDSRGITPGTDGRAMYVGPHAGLAYRMLWRVARIVLGLLFRLRVEAPFGMPGPGPYILVANHLNWMDAPAVLFSFPREPRTNFVCDDTFVVSSRLEWFVARRIQGLIPVAPSTHNGAAARQVALCLRRGGWVGIFPEGRYGREEGQLQPLRPGFARFATSLGVPVLPVAISGGRDLWFRKTITTIVGRPLPPAGRSVEQLVAETRASLLALMPPYREPRGRRWLQGWLSGAFS